MKNSKKIHICFVTGSRAEYDRVVLLLKRFSLARGVRLSIIATGAHLSKKFGYTIQLILKDGFKVAAKIKTREQTSSDQAITQSLGESTVALAAAFKKLKPDAVMLFGDRTELLAPASAAVCQKIPLIHLCGGEITEGAIDDQVRHMLTKAAHLHFAANATFAKRIRQMGEERHRVFISGSPALDMIRSQKLLSREELEREIHFKLSQSTALVTFHPETLGFENIRDQMKALLGALRQAPLNYLITYPNADAQSDVIIQALKKFSAENPGRVCLVKNLGMVRFLSTLKYVRLMIGNSSSGIVEAPSFHLPAVNIGGRQSGRVMGGNVIQAPCTKVSILKAIRSALNVKTGNYSNPYGNGKASEVIVRETLRFFRKYPRETILRKKFSKG